MQKAEIPNQIQELARLFQGRGKRLLLVGGSVRDPLLGYPISDFDLATDALPEEVRELGAQAGPDALYLVGEKFGTVGLVFGSTRVEITTFRSERYRPGSRQPEVSFIASLEGDLWRRDFTINAMAQDPLTGQILDPTGGRTDLGLRLVRAVGDPADRFAEDPLRLMRAVRFAAQLGFTIEVGTARAIREQRERLASVSAERIGEETNRLLLCPHPSHGLRLAKELGLLEMVLPELLPMEEVPQGPRGPQDALAHSLATLEGVSSDLPLRWAALLHDIGKPQTMFREESGTLHFYNHQLVGAEMVSQILARLRLDRRTTAVVAKLVRMHMRPLQYDGTWSDGAVRRLLADAGPDLARLEQLARADLQAHDGEDQEGKLAVLEELRERCAALRERHDLPQLQSPLNGRELMSLFGRGPGPWIREVKEYLREQVLDGCLSPGDKETAARLARGFVEGESHHGPETSREGASPS
jgi:poly(A) polymerase